MKGILLYDTSYGNTKKIAETITQQLMDSGVEADLSHIKDTKNLNENNYDFLVLGAPTKFGTMSFAVKFFIGKIKTEAWTGKPFAAFDTENPENIERSQKENKDWSAAEKIARKLKEKNMNQLLPVLKAQVIGQKGPIVDGEIEKAKNFASDLAAKLKAFKQHENKCAAMARDLE